MCAKKSDKHLAAAANQHLEASIDKSKIFDDASSEKDEDIDLDKISDDALENMLAAEEQELEAESAKTQEVDAPSIFSDEQDIKSPHYNDRILDATQIYLTEIGFSPLLTAEEEVHYATL